MKTAVITGATGAIGRSLIKICIEDGYEVLAVVHKGSSRASKLQEIEHCHVLWLDLSQYETAMEELEQQGITLNNYELFFHLAWMGAFGAGRDNLNLQIENIRSSLAAVQFAKNIGCRTFVGAGSQAEYGRVEGVLSPDTPTFPETGYGTAKLCASQFTRLLCQQQDLRHIWCRILSVYGPYDRDQTLISTAVNRMMRNEDTEFTACDQIWDYIYSDDAARAMLFAAQKGESGAIYMIGNGEAHPLKEYILKIAEKTAYSKEIGFGKRPYNDKQVMFLQANNEGIKKLGYKAQVKFDEGIENIIEWRKSCD